MGIKRFVFITLFVVWVSHGQAQADDIAIIVNPHLGVNALSIDEIRGIYRGDIQFLAGTRVRPIDQKETREIRSLFLDQLLQMSVKEYTKFWMHSVFAEGKNPPVLRDNNEAVIQTVQETEGGVGYVWAQEAAKAKGIKTVLVLSQAGKKGGDR
jgi:ABC-type phosphate transport system substrate-binding protein